MSACHGYSLQLGKLGMGLRLSWRRFEGAGLGSRQVVGFGTSPSQALGTKEDRADVAAFREEVMCQAEPAYGNGQRRQAPPHSAGPWMQNLSHLNCLPYPNLPLALGGHLGALPHPHQPSSGLKSAQAHQYPWAEVANSPPWWIQTSHLALPPWPKWRPQRGLAPSFSKPCPVL